MKNDYLKFLQVLCSLYDGENYVPESEIRKRWPECPSHNALLGMGKDIYFEYNHNLSFPAYLPTGPGMALVDNSRQSTTSLRVGFATLAISFLALLVAVFPYLSALLKPLLQK